MPASWTNITNAQLAIGSPVRSVDLLALRDNAAYANSVRGQVFTSNGTFTIPDGVEALKVTVIGGGGNGGEGDNSGIGWLRDGGGGGSAGSAIKYLTNLTSGSTLSVTVGGVGGTSSVASGTQTITTIQCTGGGNGDGKPNPFR